MKREMRRRARWPVVVVLCFALLASGAGVVFVHANVRLPLRPVAKPELDAAILRGMDYLDRTDSFRRTALEKGPQSIEVWIAKRILDHQAHPGLAEDVRIGWQALASSPVAALSYLPGEPRPALTRRDREVIRRLLTTATKWDSWFYFARYPEFSRERPVQFATLLDEGPSNSYGYMLTHRILAYRFFMDLNPGVAERFGIPELERRAVATLYREMFLDLRVYDLYFERVAFLLQTEPASFPVHRWVERILEEQRADGGWPHGPCIRCEVGRFLWLDWDPRVSDVHATFLAVWALVQYREEGG